MATTSNAVKEDLMNTLITKGFNPTPLDSAGNETEPENSDAFKFTFLKNGKSFGPTYVSIVDGVMTLYTNDRLEASPETNTSGSDRFTDTWTGFKKEMSKFAKDHRLEWTIDNVNHLHYDMKKRTHMKKKEKVAEGYYPLGKKASYSDNIPQVKILIQHTRQIEEGEQRYRNIARIFVENTNGERFLLPTKRPGIAKVYARHIAEGGTPYDDKGKHITNLVEEYTKMAGFVRATKNGQFNESAQRLVTEATNHYQKLRETLSHMISQRGYHRYFDSYSPVLNEESDDSTSLNELFVQETLDPRIESVMPILVRLSKNITEMNEVKALDQWAENLVNEEVRVKYEVIDKDGKRIGHWDGIVFVPYDKTKFSAGKMDMIPPGSSIDKESGPLDNKHMAMGKAGLEEIGIATLKSTEWAATDRMKKFEKEIERLKKIGDTANIAKYEKVLQHYKDLINKTKSHPGKMDTLKTAKTLGGMMPAKMKNVAEAPGAETLKHNQDTEENNLKAFGLAEGFSDSNDVADQIIDSIGGDKNLSLDDVYRAIDEYQTMMDNPHKLDVDEVAQIVLDKLHGIGELDENLDANQKRVGQLGPTEKVGPKGAVGKLVGASESVEADDLNRIKEMIGWK